MLKTVDTVTSKSKECLHVKNCRHFQVQGLGTQRALIHDITCFQVGFSLHITSSRLGEVAHSRTSLASTIIYFKDQTSCLVYLQEDFRIHSF